MSMDVGGTQGGLKADINVTPLVDVMLVLLIIMMLIAPMLQQGVAVTLPEAGNTVAKPDTQNQTVVAIDSANQFWVNGLQFPKGEFAGSGQGGARGQDRESRPHQGGQGRQVQRDHGGDGRSAARGDRGYRPHHRKENRQRNTRRRQVAMKHAHNHFGAEKVVKGEDPARQRGHERHAAHRRAARPADHLHGDPSAHAAGRRHQPAARDEGADHADRQHAGHARVHERPQDHHQPPAGHAAGTGDAPAGHLRDPQGKDDVHRRRRRAALRRDHRGDRRRQRRRRREGRHRDRRDAAGRPRPATSGH